MIKITTKRCSTFRRTACLSRCSALRGWDLVRDESEVREWILDGSPRRLRDNRLAAFFLKRQMLQMPAYRGKIDDDDVEKIVAYVRWLRKAER